MSVRNNSASFPSKARGLAAGEILELRSTLVEEGFLHSEGWGSLLPWEQMGMPYFVGIASKL